RPGRTLASTPLRPCAQRGARCERSAGGGNAVRPWVLRPAHSLDEIRRYAHVEHTAHDRDVAEEPHAICLQQPPCWRRGDIEVAVPVVAAHMRNEQLFTRRLLHGAGDVAYGGSDAARTGSVGAGGVVQVAMMEGCLTGPQHDVHRLGFVHL